MELYIPLAVWSHIEKYLLKKKIDLSKILNGQSRFCYKKQRIKVEILGYFLIRKWHFPRLMILTPNVSMNKLSDYKIILKENIS